VNCQTAIWRRRLRTDQRINPLTPLKGGVRENTFGHNDTALLTSAQHCMKHNFTTMIADFNPLAICDIQLSGIIRVD
jgi:hypothetical protein